MAPASSLTTSFFFPHSGIKAKFSETSVAVYGLVYSLVVFYRSLLRWRRAWSQRGPKMGLRHTLLILFSIDASLLQKHCKRITERLQRKFLFDAIGAEYYFHTLFEYSRLDGLDTGSRIYGKYTVLIGRSENDLPDKRNKCQGLFNKLSNFFCS